MGWSQCGSARRSCRCHCVSPAPRPGCAAPRLHVHPTCARARHSAQHTGGPRSPCAAWCTLCVPVACRSTVLGPLNSSHACQKLSSASTSTSPSTWTWTSTVVVISSPIEPTATPHPDVACGPVASVVEPQQLDRTPRRTSALPHRELDCHLAKDRNDRRPHRRTAVTSTRPATHRNGARRARAPVRGRSACMKCEVLSSACGKHAVGQQRRGGVENEVTHRPCPCAGRRARRRVGRRRSALARGRAETPPPTATGPAGCTCPPPTACSPRRAS